MRAALVLIAVASTPAAADTCEVAPPPAGVRVSIAGTHATIAIDGAGTREVDAASCAELADAVALVVAMAQPGEPEPVVREDKPQPVHPRGYALAVGYTRATSGAEALVLGADDRIETSSLGLEVALDAPETVAVGPGRIAIWSTAATAAACRYAGGFAGCALVTAGVIVGRGHDFMVAHTAVSPIVAAGLRVSWEHALAGRYGIRLHVDGLVDAVSTRFDVNRATVWANDPLSVSAGIDLAAHFP